MFELNAKKTSRPAAIFLYGIVISAQLLLGGCPPPSPVAPQYSIIRLDTRVCTAESLNENAEIVGRVQAAGEWHPFLWREDRTPRMLELPTLGGAYGLAAGINDNTEVTGYASTSDLWTHAFRWTELGGIEDLGALGVGYSAALDINNASELVGHTGYTDSTKRAMIWKPGEGMTVISGAVADTYATGINEAGTVVGAVRDESMIGTVSPPQGLVWHDDGSVEEIVNAIGGAASIATDVNAHGEVVGFAEDAGGGMRGFRWTSSGGMVDLGTLGYTNHGSFDFCSVGSSINESGDIVGSAAARGNKVHAVLWRESEMYDLNKCIPSGTKWAYLAEAVDINSSGCITGNGYIKNGATLNVAAYLLIPVLIDKINVECNTVHGGCIVSGSVTISGPAPIPLDITLQLKRLSSAAHLESAQVTIPKGGTRADFSVICAPVKTNSVGSVEALLGGRTLSTELSVAP